MAEIQHQLRIRFILRGPEFDPQDITNLLGTQPDECWREGDEWGIHLRRRPSSSWIIKVVDSYDGEHAPIAAMFERIGEVREKLDQLDPTIKRILHIAISFVVDAENSIPDIYLTPEQIHIMSELNMELIVDPYLLGDE